MRGEKIPHRAGGADARVRQKSSQDGLPWPESRVKNDTLSGTNKNDSQVNAMAMAARWRWPQAALWMGRRRLRDVHFRAPVPRLADWSLSPRSFSCSGSPPSGLVAVDKLLLLGEFAA